LLVLLLAVPIAAAQEVPPEELRSLDIRFDFEVVDRFLEFLSRGAVSQAELDRWIRLQGNRELLRHGRRQGGLSEEALKTAIRTTVRGEVFPGAGSLGRIDVGPWDVLRDMVASIRAREGELAERAERSLSPYLPAGRTIPPLQVFFHLGGSWDGRASDHVYINLTFFQERGLGSLPGLDALLVHEFYHRAQASLLGSSDDYSSRFSALFTILMRIQREGTARHLEYLYLRERFPESALDRTNFSKYRDGLHGAGEHSDMLAEILDTVEDGRRLEARRLTDQAATRGGPLYAIGHAMARTIDQNLGAAPLARAAVEGPIAFFEAYARAVEQAAEESILPVRLAEDIAALEEGYGDSWLAATLMRRAGVRALMRNDLEGAIEALGEAVRFDPSDAISSYNLACAHALQAERQETHPWRPTDLDRYARGGSRRKALRWLDEALRRGFDDLRQVRVDPDLASLHDDPGYQLILQNYGVENEPGADDR
jgi:tetratricopeptide (TPR) repeat protein